MRRRPVHLRRARANRARVLQRRGAHAADGHPLLHGAGRQSSLAISHAFLDVSTDDVFIFEQSEAAITQVAARTALQFPADSVVTEIKIKEITRRKNNAVSRVVAKHLMSIGGEQVFSGVGAWTVQPAALFRRLRRMSGTAAASAATAGQTFDSVGVADRPRADRSNNVVISRPEYVKNTAELVTSLIVDDRHPYFFDHPCDHVPGMLLLEGCAQLALAATAQTTCVSAKHCAITAYTVNFAQFVECGVLTTLTARVNTAAVTGACELPLTVDITISQQGVVSGTTTMKVALPL